MMHLYLSRAMATMDMDDMKTGTACPAFVSLHSHSVWEPNGHWRYKTWEGI